MLYIEYRDIKVKAYDNKRGNMITKTINVNELQSKVSSILKDVQADTVYEVMRYSEPVAVVLSYEKYLSFKGECKQCVKKLTNIADLLKKKNEV